MKCPNCKTETIPQQASTEAVHIEQTYCPVCEKAELTNKEETKDGQRLSNNV